MTLLLRGRLTAGDASAFPSSSEFPSACSKERKSWRTRSASTRDLGPRTTSTRALAYREATAAGISLSLFGSAAQIGRESLDQRILIGGSHPVANLLSRQV